MDKIKQAILFFLFQPNTQALDVCLDSIFKEAAGFSRYIICNAIKSILCDNSNMVSRHTHTLTSIPSSILSIRIIFPDLHPLVYLTHQPSNRSRKNCHLWPWRPGSKRAIGPGPLHNSTRWVDEW